MKTTAAQRAVVLGSAIALLLGVLHLLGVGLALLLALGLFCAFVGLVLPWVGVRWLDELILAVRSVFWSRQQGRFHSFRGVPLHIEDDGRWMWVDGDGLMRALDQREPEAALAARHAGHWRRSEDGEMMLRVDAVVQRLATMPGRTDLRVQRLRRYLEREVLYPASRRRESEHSATRR
jgi:hypothetical protein